MRITFVRHAQVEEKYLGKYNGHIDIGLSKNGYLQAKQLAHDLENEVFDEVYCSDLIRARETLKAFNLNIKPIFTDKLREKSWGIHEGKSFEEIEDSGIKYEDFEQWIDALDGENIQNYTQNVQDFFQKTLLKTKATNMLVISHAGFIKTIIGIVEKKTLKETFSITLAYSEFYIVQMI